MVLLLFNKDKDKWDTTTQEELKTMSQDIQDRSLSLPEKLITRLEFALAHQKKNNDVLGIIEGMEGSGKSS